MPNLNVEFDQFNSKEVGSSKMYTLYFLKKKYIQEKKTTIKYRNSQHFLCESENSKKPIDYK